MPKTKARPAHANGKHDAAPPAIPPPPLPPAEALAPDSQPGDPGPRCTLVFTRQSGVTVNEDTALTLGAVFACVRAISEDLAKLPWNVYEKLPGGGRERLAEDTVDWLLAVQSNPETPAFPFRETLVAHALTWGNGYAEIERDVAGRPTWLWQLTPDRVTPFRDGGRIWYEVSNTSGPPTYLPAEDVFHLRGLGFDGLVGYSVIRMAAREIGLGIAAAETGSTFYGNDSTPGGVLKHKGRLSDAARRNLAESWERRHAGAANRRRVAILEEDMDWQQTGLAPEDARLVEVMGATPAMICFVPGTGILTATGVKPIETIRPGELVLTHKGRWRPVTGVMNRLYDGEVVTTAAKGLTPVTSTPEHPFFVQHAKPSRSHQITSEGEPEWIDAGSLEPRQRVKGGSSRRRFHNLTMPRLTVEGNTTIDLIGYAPPEAVVDADTIRVNGGSVITRNPLAAYGFGWLCGLYAAEGSTSVNQSIFYLGWHEPEIVAELQARLAEVFGLKSGVYQTGEGSVARVVVANKILSTVFGQFGHVAHEKHLPAWCMAQGKEFRRGLIDGLQAGDGGAYKRDAYLRTTSLALAWQLRVMLWAEGFNTGLERTPPGVWEIRGRSGERRECWTVRWRPDSLRRGSMGLADGHVFFSLDEVTRSSYNGAVYNLEVEEDETYATVGGMAHNCRWFRVPPHKIADLLRATFSNIESQATEYVADSLTPWATRLEQEANVKLFGRTNRGRKFTKHNFNALLRGDTAARSAFYNSMLDRGVFSINDVREREDMNPIGADGDKRFVPLNMQLLENAGEDVPAPAMPRDAPPAPEEKAPPGESSGRLARLEAVCMPLLEQACQRVCKREADRAKKPDDPADRRDYALKALLAPVRVLAELYSARSDAAADVGLGRFLDRHLEGPAGEPGEMADRLRDYVRAAAGCVNVTEDKS